MKTFTVGEIQERREQFRNDRPRRCVECLGETYEYFLIPGNMNVNLPNFAFRMTPATQEIRQATSPADITLFAVSADVPAQFQHLWVLHEIIEFVHVGIEMPGRCVNASCQELVLAREQLSHGNLAEYLRLRRKFFEDLLVYSHSSPQSFVSGDIREFIGSYGCFACAQEDQTRLLPKEQE